MWRKYTLLNYLAAISILKTDLELLEGKYLANPGEFRKRLTPTLAECAQNTPRVDGRIRWNDFITFLTDEGLTELFWVLRDWALERGLTIPTPNKEDAA